MTWIHRSKWIARNDGIYHYSPSLRGALLRGNPQTNFMQNTQLKNFLLLIALACCWSPSFLFIKIAIEFVPPFTLIFLRVAMAAALLYLVLKFKKINLPTTKNAWKNFTIMGFFSCAFPFALFAVGEQFIDSSLASIINGSTPLFTLIIAHFFIQNDRLSKTKFYGSIIGFFGLFVLVAPTLFQAHATIPGIIAVTCAAASYGIGIVYTKKNMQNSKPLATATAQLIMSSLFLLPFSLMENPFAIQQISGAAVFSIISLAILGTVIAFIIYYQLISATSATYVSAVTYIMPIFGMILGATILAEQLTWNSYVGSSLILLGVMTVNGVFGNLDLIKKKN